MMREAEAIAESSASRSGSASTSASRAPRASARTRRRCCRTSSRAAPIEIDALVGSVVELGRMTDTPTPHIDAVYALRQPAGEDARGQHGSCASRRHPTHADNATSYRPYDRRNHSRAARGRRGRRDGTQRAGRHAAHLSRAAHARRRRCAALAARGIGPRDRVAIVLDNGPEMAAAFWRSPRPRPRRR